MKNLECLPITQFMGYNIIPYDLCLFYPPSHQAEDEKTHAYCVQLQPPLDSTRINYMEY
ncbi:hypothetical protein SESBI_00914 [Sesbania bispinosa]|nr:hypothetical protein SESBI_00914 [Sesbania bispinosa]